MNDNKPKVTGIGGIFFKAKQPDKLKEWYGNHLGLTIDQWGSLFSSLNINQPDEINYLQWSIMKEDDGYFDPSSSPFMINYRVQEIEQLVKHLSSKGVTICDEITSYDYGKFVHILDPEGNKIELWEPIDHVFTQLNNKEEE